VWKIAEHGVTYWTFDLLLFACTRGSVVCVHQQMLFLGSLELPSASYSADVPLTSCSINPLFSDCDVYAQNFWQVFFSTIGHKCDQTSEHKFAAALTINFPRETWTFSEKMDIATLTTSSNTKRTPKLQGCSRINKQMLSVHTALAYIEMLVQSFVFH